MESINCKHPVIIFNPAALDVIALGGAHIVVDGIINHRIYNAHHQFRKAGWHPSRQGVTSLNYLNWQVSSLYTKDYVSLYICVPCGRCALCNARKREDWSIRFHAESQVSSTLPVFFTLTYNEENVPYNYYYKVTRNGHELKKVRSLRKEDVQKFLKRLRIYFERKLNYTTKIRYAAVGEYGKTTHRPHYHICVWNWPSPVDLGVNTSLQPDVQDIHFIQKSEAILHETWKLCNDNKSFDFDYAGVTKSIVNGKRYRNTGHKGESKGVAKYVAKYVTKKCYVPRFAEKNRMLCSNRNGGIGVPYLRKDISVYRIPLNSQFLHIQDSKYIMPRLFKLWLFPSPSKLLNGVYDKLKVLSYHLNQYNTLLSYAHLSSNINSPIVSLITLLPSYCKTFVPRYISQLNDKPISYYRYAIHFSEMMSDLRHTLSIIKPTILQEIQEIQDYLDSKSLSVSQLLTIYQLKKNYQSAMAELPFRLYDTETSNQIQIYYDNLTDKKRTI